ncbi:hypothetical protein [Bradyrhizobium stylosanthis]|uniref:hypothetical protein n=1 Tax=Bradyrhizobium stylosanthis TaxID=1803665 RepID=UPI0011A875C6|nr:hypothetical protein [Bradyrhizobium stylosanthis]
MAEQIHRGLYEMVVIARVGSMKFLPFMNRRVRRPAARDGIRSQMLNSAGKTRVSGFRRCGCAGKSVLDFGRYGVELDLQ